MNPWHADLEQRKTIGEVRVPGASLKVGDRVRLRPRRRADILDIALAGEPATIEAIEEDYERAVHVAVVLDNDPGKDMGALRQPGHRFFFGLDEIEPLTVPNGIEGGELR